mmetsp:Transcript_134337/g.429028  ORF Transcript_134337/g.429028 Transcript_134337/m.429028 type:complete len:281 (+) Transcript_134337:510-1352(+)
MGCCLRLQVFVGHWISPGYARIFQTCDTYAHTWANDSLCQRPGASSAHDCAKGQGAGGDYQQGHVSNVDSIVRCEAEVGLGLLHRGAFGSVRSVADAAVFQRGVSAGRPQLSELHGHHGRGRSGPKDLGARFELCRLSGSGWSFPRAAERCSWSDLQHGGVLRPARGRRPAHVVPSRLALAQGGRRHARRVRSCSICTERSARLSPSSASAPAPRQFFIGLLSYVHRLFGLHRKCGEVRFFCDVRLFCIHQQGSQRGDPDDSRLQWLSCCPCCGSAQHHS